MSNYEDTNPKIHIHSITGKLFIRAQIMYFSHNLTNDDATKFQMREVEVSAALLCIILALQPVC